MDLRRIEHHFESPVKGSVLISEPFLYDLHFRKTIILLSEHNEEGSVGFVLNRQLNLHSGEVVPGLLQHQFPLFYGGPVENNTLHFIHKTGDLIKGSRQISNGIYWGGDIEIVNDLLHHKVAKPEEFKFFLGYSGWSADQLEEEIRQKAWWIIGGNEQLAFDEDLENMWKKSVKTLGQDFAYLADSPEDPLWN